MSIRFIFAIAIGKLTRLLLRLFDREAGTWPGEIALRLNPHILSSLVGGFRKGIILVAGTNGKTTTSLMIKTILEAQGLSVVHNASGANLLNGIVSACIQQAQWTGKLHADYGVFEVDENSLSQVLSDMRQETSKNQKLVIVLLNLFRDQLDRYGEVDVIAEKWQTALDGLSKDTTLIVNTDDPLIAHLGIHSKLSVTYFGIDDKTKYLAKIDHATDSIFCLNCGARLKYEGIYFSHIGTWCCPGCGQKRPTPEVNNVMSPLPGLYNLYNTLAAVAVSKAVDIKPKTINTALSGFTPAFGRQEEFVVNGRTVKIFLSKNPAGFNESLRTVIQLGAKQMLFVLNDRIPDGRDVSWIWDVDFEMIPKHVSVIVSGDRVYDLALRLKYAGVPVTISKRLDDALKTDTTLYVLPTYSAMLEVRKILKGRKIL